MPVPFARTVAALCEAIAGDAGGAGAFVLRQIERAPDWFRPAVACGTAVLWCWSVLRTGRSPARLPLARRRALVAGWRRSRIAPVRNLIRFYDGMTTFAVATAAEPTGD